MVALVYGAAVGLLRMGWALPLPHADWLGIHGPLMVCGFLGTVIGLERAVALGRTWAFGAPTLTALGVLALLVVPDSAAGAWLVAAASAVLVAIYVAATAGQPSLHAFTMGLGAVLWLAGNVTWLSGWPVFRVVWFWAGFPLLTIAGERLELTRFLKPTRWGRASFLLILAGVVAAIAAAAIAPARGVWALGLAFLALAAWLGRYDIARRTVRQHGLARFVAACLLSGYAWLGVAGGIVLVHAGELSGPAYDAAFHALFLGFVFSMIFGHAPIIFPAVLRVSMAFRSRFYAHLVLLHLSLALRVAGDLDTAWRDGAWGWARPWGGLLNTAALLLFLVNTVSSLRWEEPAGRREGAVTP